MWPNRKDLPVILCLAGGWLAWAFLDVLQVSVAYAEDQFECRVALYGLKVAFPWRAWIPAGVGITFASRSFLAGKGNRDRAQKLYIALLVIVGAKLVSLLPVVGLICPPVGLLWSDHLSWAVSVSILVFLVYPDVRSLLEDRSRATGYVILISFATLYLLYGIFYVRTTLLHGDEPQFMMITQSLLRDGDIDLANTREADHLEYHQVEKIRPHKAPASPEGKLHNTHPPGIAAAVVPAYWLGHRLIEHPRLAVCLFLALIAAVGVFLIYTLISKAGFDPVVSLVVTVTAGLSPLLFLYSNQIYPDIMALVFFVPTLILAVDTDSVRGKSFYSACVALALLLPILHPRLLPLTCLMGWFLWQRIQDHPLRSELIRTGLVASGAAFVLYVGYHLHYTGDIWGAYKPGNAWKAWAFDPKVTVIALAGQWLDFRIGLLNNAPIFGLALPGILLLYRDHRKLAVMVILVYGTTACVNANSDDWRFGYCYASRFMVSAIPALVLPLAVVLQRGLARHPLFLMLFAFGAAISMDTVVEAVVLPEAAYLGKHLIDRSIASIYPMVLHFPDLSDSAAIPWGDCFFWLLLGGAPAMVFYTRNRYRWAAVIAVVLLLPFATVSNADYVARFDHVSAMLETFGAAGKPGVDIVQKTAQFSPGPGTVREDGYYVVRTSGPSMAGFSSLPNISPSVYGAAVPVDADVNASGSTNVSYVVLERVSVRAYGNHETRYALQPEGGGAIAFHRIVRSEGRSMAFQFMIYDGTGFLSFGQTKVVINPARIIETTRPVYVNDINLPRPGERAFALSFVASNLDAGFYRLRLSVEDVDPAIWLARRADPIMFFVFPANLEDGRKKSEMWAPMLGRAIEASPPEGAERPLVEAYLAPHWSMVPYLGKQRMQFEFENDRKQDIYVAGVYYGEYDLRLREITLEKRSFETWQDGALKPLSLPGRDVTE